MRSSPSLEQLYVFGGSGAYRPHLLAEAHRHAERAAERRASSTTVSSSSRRCTPATARVHWSEARPIDPETLDIRAVPDPNHDVDDSLKPETLMQGALQSEDAFRQFVGRARRR